MSGEEPAVRTEVVKVTAEMAAAWLERNRNVRGVRQATVNKYAATMREGGWKLTHQGIAFDETGNLVDGQHRLWAIVESGVPCEMQVTRGLGQSNMSGVDGGLPRRLFEHIHSAYGEIYSKEMVAAARSAMRGHTTDFSLVSRVSVAEMRNFIKAHEVSLRFAVEGLVTKKIGRASVRGAVARAHASVDKGDRERLVQFVDILNKGVGAAEASLTVIILRDWLLGIDASGALISLEVYEKTCRSLHAFLQGEVLRKLYRATQDYFPLAPRGGSR